MKSIAYIIPYFGKLPKNFPLWLLGCKCNPTVNWIILTDDKTIYDYPLNVKVIYTSYQNVVNRIKSHFDFEVLIEKYPETLKCIPLLLAVRANEIYAIDGDGEFTYKFNNPNLSVEQYKVFMRKIIAIILNSC